ncbi:hypothetical protein [Falsiroseomonas oryziterrae]|uniref:hypothetical protein n=1 Tax=Falsiroseomonas oryziterrae TaxID=2911368 RepID=UPI001F35896C|nr:hypothetical protein [Roseomonas sp. NPKOSM-4]
MRYSATEYREKLEEFVWRLVPMAETGSDLIGLGEVIDTLTAFARLEDEREDDDEAVREHEIAIIVGLTIGFRVSDDCVQSGALYTLRVSDEGIEFDVTETYYERGVGSDNCSRSLGFVGWRGSVRDEPMDWFEGAQMLIGDSAAKFSVSRDHV